MAKQLLKERFQELAGIKSLSEEFKEDMASKAISVLKSYEGEVKGLENYIKYLMNTSDDISSSIQAVADDMDRDNGAEDSLRRDLEKLSLSEGSLKEELKAPSGWTEIKDLSDMHRSEEDDEIAVKAWDAPMEGWDEKNKDIIVVRKEDDKFYLDGYVPFGDFEMQGPFNTYEETLKLAVGEMEAFKEDWDEQ